MEATAARWWQALRDFGPWVVIELLLPGATLFALLLLLSRRFVRDGFGDVRQHAFGPGAGRWPVIARERRNWWSCTCAGIAACRCLGGALGRGVRRCCMKLLELRSLPLARAA